MPDIALPEEIQQIIWKRVYSDNILSNIIEHSYKINMRLQNNGIFIPRYTLYYNVLRIMSGMASLSYST